MATSNAGKGAESLRHWESRLATLAREDWDRRVRISAGDRDGARVGSVAQVPPVGIKLALRQAMIDRARAEIARQDAEDRLRALELKRMTRTGVSFGAGGVIVAIIAISARVFLG